MIKLLSITMNCSQNDSKQIDYLEQLKIPHDNQTMHNLSVLLEYHLLYQRKLLDLLIPFNMIKNDSLMQEKDKNIGKHRCLARIHNKNQCSRKCKNDTVNFCGSHLHSLPYGRIDQKLETVGKLFEKKTRGRKSKTKSTIELEQIDLKDYIKTEIIIIDGNEFLVDENNVIFENNCINTIIGIQTNQNEYQWF